MSPLSVRSVDGAGEGSSDLTAVVTGAQILFSPLLLTRDNLDAVRARLALTLRVEDGWQPSDHGDPAIGSYASGGGLADRTRPVLCVRTGNLTTEGTGTAFPAHWQIGAVTLTVSDVGAAVIRFDVRVPAETNDSARAQVADEIKQLLWLRASDGTPARPVVPTAIDAFFRESQRQLLQALTPLHPDPELSSFDSVDEDRRQLGRLLWLHPVYIVPADPVDNAVAAARGLSSPFISSEVTFRGGVLSAGIGRSAISTTSETANDVADVLELIELHWVVFATFMWLDALVRRRLETDAQASASSRRDLTEAAERAFDLYVAARRTLTNADSVLAGLGGDMHRLWNAIADVQSTAGLIDGVDRKLILLREVAERRAQDAAQFTARRTETALAALSLLSSITVVIAIATFLIGDLQAQTGDAIVRFWTLLTAAGACVALAIAVLGLRRRFPKTPTRPRRRSGAHDRR